MRITATVLIWILSILLIPLPGSSASSIREEVYQRLTRIREKKKKQLIDYVESIRRNADSVRSDRIMIDFFNLKNRYYQLQKIASPPKSLSRDIETLKQKIQEHYLKRYLAFYDILFVGRNGDIFYTIRKQSDYHQNIFQGPLAKTSLAKQLQENPRQTFVDFHYYYVSDEPSAFLIVPVTENEELSGWFIFQCAINKINRIFAQEEGLGATGEVFLVNRQSYMLTDSRFYGKSSILEKHLSTRNITGKFQEGVGRKIVVDYRGFRVLSSFAVCRVANTEWLVIAKIDEDEVITDQYQKNRPELQSRLQEHLRGKEISFCAGKSFSGQATVVDLDEFQKTTERKLLRTFGVSTCTGVIVTLPQKFSYMAHISNIDRLYGAETTDLVTNVFRRINNFDTYRYERRYLRVTVVANHQKTILPLIDRLIREGLFLSQITFMYNARAKYANITHDSDTGRTMVQWKMAEPNDDTHFQCDSGVENVGDIVKELLAYRCRKNSTAAK